MTSIHFFVLNLDKNIERYINISNQLNKLYINFTRIKAIEGENMENDKDAQLILQPRMNLLYKKLINITTNEEWIYDGSVNKSFPNCSLYGNAGTKGLTLSNLKAFIEADKMDNDWFCILEDDAEVNEESYKKILKFINNPLHKNIDIVLLDSRHYGWGGCSGMLYNKKIITKLINDLHPLSSFSMNSHLYGDPNLGNLWDWKLWKYISHINNNFEQIPCIGSGAYPSTINV